MDLRRFWSLIGGPRGLFMLAALAAAGTLIPWKFGFLFPDPAILTAYTAIAVLFASNFTVDGVVGQKEDAVVRTTVRWGTAWGFAGWAVILGAAFAALAQWKGRLVLPPGLTLLALGAFTAAAAWLAACLAAVAALSVSSAKTGRDLMRLGFFFIVMVLIFATRFGPASWQETLSRPLRQGRFPFTLALAVPFLLAAGWFFLRRTRAMLADRRRGLSILDG
ncbi:MAG: hypothetical protein HY858_14720 [Candidatus Solibacter usitatus]|nr:hypothetical protein [Candidatus Solibacter usitatus]